jgi:hypothetical protein
VFNGDPLGGWWYLIVGHDRATGTIVSREPVCVPFPDPSDPGPPPPPPVPQPPTIGEIWRAVDLPVPAIGVNPSDRGVTGLETWLWTATPDSVVIDVTIDGFVVTGTARVVGYRFDTGDGAVIDAAGPGTETEPAARHTYETKRTYDLHVETVWQADAVMDGPDLTAPVRVDLNQAVVRSTRSYQVVEVRSILVR